MTKSLPSALFLMQSNAFERESQQSGPKLARCHRRHPPRLVFRFSSCVAEADPSTWRFAGFSSKWRTAFSHLCGGSYNCTVVQLSLGEDGGQHSGVIRARE